jgi:SMI1-KNR4 cell-wall
MLTEWEDLLNSLNLTGVACISSEQEISEFEEKCGFKVPESYKNYCRVFGRGTFKDKDITIYEIWPPDWIDEIVLERLSMREAQFVDDDSPLAIHLKDHGCYIGLAEDICFFWDLDSYQESDDEYDIYARTESDNGLYKVGRNFLQFIQDFCIGQVGIRDFPDLIFLSTDENDNPLNTNEFTRPKVVRQEYYERGNG